jgi:hypothetical protein
MQIDLLVRVLTEVVRGHVAGDHDHRNAIERSIGDASGGVRQPGSEMREQY